MLNVFMRNGFVLFHFLCHSIQLSIDSFDYWLHSWHRFDAIHASDLSSDATHTSEHIRFVGQSETQILKIQSSHLIIF